MRLALGVTALIYIVEVAAGVTKGLATDGVLVAILALLVLADHPEDYT